LDAEGGATITFGLGPNNPGSKQVESESPGSPTFKTCKVNFPSAHLLAEVLLTKVGMRAMLTHCKCELGRSQQQQGGVHLTT